MNCLKLTSLFRVSLLLSLGLSLLASVSSAETNDSQQVLVFSKTAGFRHDSIEVGVEAIKNLGETHDFKVEATEDSAAFTPENLAKFQAIIFLNTTGTLFDADQRSAFEQYVRGGGGFIGIHSASDTEYGWECYGDVVGAYFQSHPHIQEAVIQVENHQHPATAHLPEKWKRTDEWYNFKENPREDVQVLMSLDTESYEGSTMGDDHPIAWYHEFDEGRAFYTAIGHTKESFAEEAVLKHLLGAIRWATGSAEL